VRHNFMALLQKDKL